MKEKDGNTTKTPCEGRALLVASTENTKLRNISVRLIFYQRIFHVDKSVGFGLLSLKAFVGLCLKILLV